MNTFYRILYAVLSINASSSYGYDFNQESLTQEYSSCSPLNCDQSCRRIGFPGGACVNGKCKCDIILSLKDFNQETQMYNLHLSVIIKIVSDFNQESPLNCDQSCRRIGFPGGACVNGKCKCDIILSLKDFNQESLQEYSSCSPLNCDQSCRRIGFPGGACVNGKCKCDIILSLKDFNQESLQEYSSCSPLNCDQSCRRIGFPGGACVNGKCKCDIILSLKDVLGDFLTMNICNNSVCNRMCQEMNNHSGMCLGGDCKCF
ncbi:unnamed protein product [Parnassius apollo]|uniref:(apollo) hypothetical protein n=1 Tax=Parnassius apollo TaxID=110799 RepID=A0A8S3Y833_PARAO|nr:unnamed protein product [Parnassius apollo]